VLLIERAHISIFIVESIVEINKIYEEEIENILKAQGIRLKQ